MLSVTIFLVVITIILISFNRISEQSRQEDLGTDLESGSLFATDVLMKTEGFPTNWTNTTVIVPGFLENGSLSINKILKFIQLDYKNSTYMLGLSGFNFCMSVYNLSPDKTNNTRCQPGQNSDTPIVSGNQNLSYGMPFVSGERLSVTDRVGVMDGHIVKIRFLVWK